MNKRFRLLMAIIYAALALLVFALFGNIFTQKGKVSAVFILLLTVLLCASHWMLRWIRSGVVKPLEQLKESIDKVCEGDLEHIMDIDDDNELGELCESFEKLRIKLKTDEADREKTERENRELIGNISHDLKSPLTAIKGFSEGLIDGVITSPEKQEKYIKTIYSKANEMDKFIDELIYYTKIDTNRIPYHFEVVRVRDFFDDCVEDVGLYLDTKKIVFSHETNVSETVRIIADTEQLRRVAYNFINNAVKYMDKSPGVITMRCIDNGDFVRLECADNGVGIATKHLPYLFDRFYRTDESRNSKTGGSGIGLSICKKIVEDHGGRIWATSTLGEGTNFIIQLRKYEEEINEQNSDN